MILEKEELAATDWLRDCYNFFNKDSYEQGINYYLAKKHYSEMEAMKSQVKGCKVENEDDFSPEIKQLGRKTENLINFQKESIFTKNCTKKLVRS